MAAGGRGTTTSRWMANLETAAHQSRHHWSQRPPSRWLGPDVGDVKRRPPITAICQRRRNGLHVQQHQRQHRDRQAPASLQERSPSARPGRRAPGATTPFAITFAPGNTGNSSSATSRPAATRSVRPIGTRVRPEVAAMRHGANSTAPCLPARSSDIGTVNVDPGGQSSAPSAAPRRARSHRQGRRPTCRPRLDSPHRATVELHHQGWLASFSNITAPRNGTTYPVVEGIAAGPSIRCSNRHRHPSYPEGRLRWSRRDRDVHVQLAAPAALSLTKSVSGVDSTYPWSFDFTLTPPGAPSGTKSFAGTGNTTSVAQTWADLVPGQSYNLGEQAAPGWTASIACTLTAADGSSSSSAALPFTFIAQPGEAIACAATNAALPATLNVTKSVTGLDPSADWGPFTITLTQVRPRPATRLEG